MRPERGFTLIELMVALTVGALLVLMAHRAFGAATDLRFALDRYRTAHDERMEARRHLVSLLGSVDVTSPAATGFRGTPARMAFTSCEHGAPRAVALFVSGEWLLALAGSDTTRLWRTTGIAAEYLLAYGATAAWVQEWQSPASAPLAVRLRIERADSSGVVDTLLLAIGPRG